MFIYRYVIFQCFLCQQLWSLEIHPRGDAVSLWILGGGAPPDRFNWCFWLYAKIQDCESQVGKLLQNIGALITLIIPGFFWDFKILDSRPYFCLSRMLSFHGTSCFTIPHPFEVVLFYLESPWATNPVGFDLFGGIVSIYHSRECFLLHEWQENPIKRGPSIIAIHCVMLRWTLFIIYLYVVLQRISTIF